MGALRGLVVTVLAASIVGAGSGCRKTPKNAGAIDSGTTLFVLEPVTDEPSVLCRETYPCPTNTTYRPFLCAISGERAEGAAYSAPGVRIERLECRYAKEGEDAVVGVPLDGSPHLRYAELFARVRGSPRERALAAAELLLERQLDEGACPIVDDGAAIRFCVRSSEIWASRCVAYPDGAVACSRDGSDRPLQACRTHRPARLTAVELSRGVEPPLATTMMSLPGNHLVPRDDAGASGVALRASGLRVHHAACSDAGFYRGVTSDGYWGEDERGNVLVGADLVRRLDDVVMRAAVAVEAIPQEQRESQWMMLDRDDGRPNRRGKADCFPPGPRETGDTIQLFTWESAAEGPRIRRCTVSPGRWSGACEVVPPDTYCG